MPDSESARDLHESYDAEIHGSTAEIPWDFSWDDDDTLIPEGSNA